MKLNKFKPLDMPNRRLGLYLRQAGIFVDCVHCANMDMCVFGSFFITPCFIVDLTNVFRRVSLYLCFR